jgi:hypothetical protein
MKTSLPRKLPTISLSVLFIALLSFQTLFAAEAEKKSIAIMPLNIHAQKDLSYLKNGIRNMLASRLAANTGLEITDASQVAKQAAAAAPLSHPAQYQKLGQDVAAEYVLNVDLTAIGNSYSLDAKIYTSDGSKPVETYYASAGDENEIIAAVDTLTRDISSRSFGIGASASTVSAPAMPAVTQPVSPSSPTAPTTPFQTAHPDRAFMQPGQYGYPQSSPFIRPMEITGGGNFVKTQNLNYGIHAMDIGDVDGDGIDDVVIASSDAVNVYHLNGNRLQEFGRIPTLTRNIIIGVNLADLNNNGKAEIYVTAIDWVTPNSFGAEWQNNGFTYLFQNEKWHIKSMKVGSRMILAGQSGGVDIPYTPGIFEMEVIDGSLKSAAKLPVPGKINLWDFSMADLDQNGKVEVIAIDQHDRMKVLQTGGKQMWKSDDRFGGSLLYVGGASPTSFTKDVDKYEEPPDGQDDQSIDRIYIPSRIVVQDVNNDNLPDIIINKNLSTASRMMRNLKNYPSGEIHGLSWSGIGMNELWRTQKIDGYVASYQLVPDKQDTNKALLYVALIMRTGWLDIFQAQESSLLIFPLDFTKKEQSAAH